MTITDYDCTSEQGIRLILTDRAALTFWHCGTVAIHWSLVVTSRAERQCIVNQLMSFLFLSFLQYHLQTTFTWQCELD